MDKGKQMWCSGESTRLPPMWPGFKSRRQRHIWAEFFVGFLYLSFCKTCQVLSLLFDHRLLCLHENKNFHTRFIQNYSTGHVVTCFLPKNELKFSYYGFL